MVGNEKFDHFIIRDDEVHLRNAKMAKQRTKTENLVAIKRFNPRLLRI